MVQTAHAHLVVVVLMLGVTAATDCSGSLDIDRIDFGRRREGQVPCPLCGCGGLDQALGRVVRVSGRGG